MNGWKIETSCLKRLDCFRKNIRKRMIGRLRENKTVLYRKRGQRKKLIIVKKLKLYENYERN